MKRMLQRLFRVKAENKVVPLEAGGNSKTLKTPNVKKRFNGKKKSKTGETCDRGENENENARRNENQNSIRHPHDAGPTLTGEEFMSITVHSWFINTNYQQEGNFSPCVPRRLFPLNMSLAVKTVSDDHIAILYQTLLGGMVSNLQSIMLNPGFSSRKFCSHLHLKNLERHHALRKPLHKTQGHHQDLSDFTDLPGPPGYIDEYNAHSGHDVPSLPLSNIVESLSGVPIHSRNPDEASMIRRRDVMLARLKDNLRHATSSPGLIDNSVQGDERLVCKVLIIMEIWLFGPPQAPVIGVDEVVEDGEARIVRWQRRLEQYQKSKLNSNGAAMDSMLEAGSLDIGAEISNVHSISGHQLLKKCESSTRASFLPKIKKKVSSGLFSTTARPSAASQGLGSQGPAPGNRVSTCRSCTPSQPAINDKYANLDPNSSPKAANSEFSPASRSSSTTRGLVNERLLNCPHESGLLNTRHGPACDRDSLMHQMGILHFGGRHFPENQRAPDDAHDLWYSDDRWYLHLEYKYSVFHQSFRLCEQEFYLVIDRHNGDEEKLDYIMKEYGI